MPSVRCGHYCNKVGKENKEMTMMESAGIKESLTITVKDVDGTVIGTRSTPKSLWEQILERLRRLVGRGRCCNDILVNDGIEDVQTLIRNRYNWISVGVDCTLPGTTDTQLLSEVQTRIEAAKSATSTFYPNDTARFEGEFIASTDRTICEAGIHVAETSSGDVMLCRETYVPIVLTTGQSAYFVWDVVVTR